MDIYILYSGWTAAKCKPNGAVSALKTHHNIRGKEISTQGLLALHFLGAFDHVSQSSSHELNVKQWSATKLLSG